jgi:hypothetical protein
VAAAIRHDPDLFRGLLVDLLRDDLADLVRDLLAAELPQAVAYLVRRPQ